MAKCQSAEPIDDQIDLLAIQLDLMQLDDAWADEHELFDEAVTDLEAFTVEAYLLF